MDAVRRHLNMTASNLNISIEDAASQMIQIGMPEDSVRAALEEQRKIAKKTQSLDVPAGVTKLEYERLTDELRAVHWYGGPASFDKHWPPLREQMASDIGTEASDSVHVASEKVLGLLADPGIHKLKKKGLVIGYVQSGKTANYAAVLSKASDRGFRLFIVMSGIHNALRAQTQVRLDRDLISNYPDRFVKMTNADQDFGQVIEGGGLLASHDLRNLIVIKKNASRLNRLALWLESIPEKIRERCPTIIIDDESVQATPNSKAAQKKVSRINELTNRIYELLPTATYVGYTATPFANVLMNPSDDQDLYPSDFIMALPRPAAYFGAERLFGREPLNEDDVDSEGLDLIRRITDDEAEALLPPKKNENKPILSTTPESLVEALRWFILSVAARRLRGQGNKHTSMLVHTSHLTDSHNLLAGLIEDTLDGMVVGGQSKELIDAELEKFETLWNRERARVQIGGNPLHAFEELLPVVPSVLQDLRVIIDNGGSDDRLNYEGDLPATVIAVGGQTLSRGLTLEGLTVSWFARTSKTYDTLLQMGRWFGYRVGYEDLPRVWMTETMQENFRDLATVEQELRNDIDQYSVSGITPRQLGLRIRQHPTMAVTAASKMYYASNVQVSYAGLLKQTYKFDHKNHDVQRANIETTKSLVAGVQELGIEFSDVRKRWLARDVPSELVVSFLRNFAVSGEQTDLQPDVTVDYLKQREDKAASLWNVAIMSSTRTKHEYEGKLFEPGQLDLGLNVEVNLYNRAPLAGKGAHANIKALVSTTEQTIDIDSKRNGAKLRSFRAEHAEGRGLLLIYPISGKSRPLSDSTKSSREAFEGAIDMVGFGLIFPDHIGSDGAIKISEHDYVGLPAHLMAEVFDAPEEVDEAEIASLDGDDEGSMSVDGRERLGEEG